MQILRFSILILASIVALSTATQYNRIPGFFEGSSIDLWNFGASSAASRSVGDAWTPILVYPNTTTTGPDGGSRGEIEELLCGEPQTPCPQIFSSPATASLWKTWQAIFDSWRYESSNASYVWTGANSTYTSYSTFQQKNNYTISSGTIYRRMVNSEDRLQIGPSILMAPTAGVSEGNPVYYFAFGTDYYGTVNNAVYQIVGGPTILLNTATRFVKVYNIVPPEGNTVSPTRYSEIPSDWFSNPNITTTDGIIYEYGFNAVAATPPPVAAASTIVPTLFVALLAILASLVL